MILLLFLLYFSRSQYPAWLLIVRGDLTIDPLLLAFPAESGLDPDLLDDPVYTRSGSFIGGFLQLRFFLFFFFSSFLFPESPNGDVSVPARKRKDQKKNRQEEKTTAGLRFVWNRARLTLAACILTTPSRFLLAAFSKPSLLLPLLPLLPLHYYYYNYTPTPRLRHPYSPPAPCSRFPVPSPRTQLLHPTALAGRPHPPDTWALGELSETKNHLPKLPYLPN